MLKDIRLHIEQDEEKQKKLEKKLAKRIHEINKTNLNAFQRNIPTVTSIINHTKSQNISIICNKWGHFNIVDFGTGRVFYGFFPEEEVEDHVGHFLEHGQHILLSDEMPPRQEIKDSFDQTLISLAPRLSNYLSYPPVPENIECLVILGIGLGYHIGRLIEKCSPKFIVIYEPETQYFLASTLVYDWAKVLDVCRKKNISLFFMIGKDGRELIPNIKELCGQFPISSFYLYKHYNHPIFNSLQQQLDENSWFSICKKGFQFSTSEDKNQYTAVFTPSVGLENCSLATKSNEKFQKNLNSFSKYLPHIHKQFVNYEPKIWLPFINSKGEINTLNKDKLVSMYGSSPLEECRASFEGFVKHPHKDGLVLGYKGKKLAHYTHYKFVKETEELLEKAEEEEGALPNDLLSLIMFGLGVGYNLDLLLEKRSLEKLFLCEPNPDFFYASLYAIDWESVFESFDHDKGRLYINIGDDGSHLVADLLSQFYSIGPYILNNTFFYQGYYNASLNEAIAGLRDQLRIVICMGEYFDHAYYGISQTKESLRRECSFLMKDPWRCLTYEEKEVPVFIVGNGPSLDNALPVIKEYQGRAIIISCGTALQALHKNGITPDLHAEIEQNRANFDWACKIDDFAYLKKISLISCNGVHPDTCDLYKDVFITFKEGESSTVSTTTALKSCDFTLLKYAFPTVTNFVCNLVSQFKMSNVYLFGVDLGFINDKNHHSKSSGYYNEDGKELYDYTKDQNTSFVVAGNFRTSVYTKHEFKLSKLILEQLVAETNKEVNFYNCSDGAKVLGTSPLLIEDILITTSEKQKENSLNQLKSAFQMIRKEHGIKKFESKFTHEQLEQDLSVFHQNLNESVSSFEEAQKFIDRQKDILFRSYQNGKSLLFYYLYGTNNYASAILSKLLYSSKVDGLTQFQHGLEIWRKYYCEIQKSILSPHESFDFSISPHYTLDRTFTILNSLLKKNKILVITTNEVFKEALTYWINKKLHSLSENYDFVSSVELVDPEKQYDYVVFHIQNNQSLSGISRKEVIDSIQIKGAKNTIYIDYLLDESQIRHIGKIVKNLTILKVAKPQYIDGMPMWYADMIRIALSTLFVITETNYHVVFPTYPVQKNIDIQMLRDSINFEPNDRDGIFQHFRHLCIDLDREKRNNGIMQIGDRGKPLSPEKWLESFVSFELDKKEAKNTFDAITKLVPKSI